MMRTKFVLILALPLFVVCDPGADEKPVVVRHSTDWKISNLWSAECSSLRIQALDTLMDPNASRPAIGRLGQVAVNGSGGLIAVDEMTQDVWVGMGSPLEWRIIRRRGSGPAEIRAASGVWWMDDIPAVLDRARGRVLAGRDQPIVFELATRGSSTSHVKAAFGDHSGVLLTQAAVVAVEADPGTNRPPVTVTWRNLRGDANSPDTLLTVAGRTWVVSANGYGELPFAPRAHVAASTAHFAAGDGGRPEIHLFDRNGLRRILISWDDPQRPLADAATDAFIAASLDLVPPEQRTAGRRILREVPYPDSLPHYDMLLVSADAIWTGRWMDPEPPVPAWPITATEWRIIPVVGGREIECLRFPSGMRPVGFMPDGAPLVRLRDDLGRDGLAIVTLVPELSP